MELTGLDENGKLVRSNAIDFAKANAGKDEQFYGVGSSPHMAVYLNAATQQTREVDLRKLATVGGLNDVQFNFDRKMAKESGLLHEQDVDQSIAYNLERIKTTEGKTKYLADKGVQGFFSDKDGDYYTVQSGKIVTLNNKAGFDLSDLTRMGAHAGRDLGAMTAVAATGVGAAATGGASLAVAGAAGAGGAVLGEAAQRGIDKLFGADADKYNADLSAWDETKELAKTGGIGALQGVGGQVAGRLLGAGSVQATAGLAAVAKKTGLAEEFMANMAAKTEAGYLAAKMPQGWMAGKLGSTTEEAAARGLLEQAQASKTAQEAASLVGEAKNELALGTAKKTGNAADLSIAMEQKAKYEQYKIMVKNEADAAEKRVMTEYADKETIKEQFAVYKEKMTQNALDTFSQHTREVEEILKEGGDQEAARKAYNVIEGKFIKGLESKGIVVERDVAGNVTGIEKGSSQAFIQRTLDDSIAEASDYTSKIAAQALQFKQVPSDKARASTVSSINNIISAAKHTNVDDKVKERIINEGRKLVKSISRHDIDNGEDVGFQMSKFLEFSRDLADMRDLPPSFHNAVRVGNERIYQYAAEGSRFPNAVKDMAHLQESVLAIRSTRRSQVFDQEGGTQRMLQQLSDLQTMTGDAPTASNNIATVLHVEDMLANNPQSKFWSFMTDADRARIQAVQLLRSEVASKKAAAVKTEKKMFSPGGFVGAATEFALTGQVGLTGLIAGEATKAILDVVKKPLLKGAAWSAKKAGKATEKAIKSQPFKRAAASYGMAQTEEQLMVGKRLQNWMTPGNNDE